MADDGADAGALGAPVLIHGEPQTSPRYSDAELRRVDAMRHAEVLNPKTFADWRDLTLKVEAFIREADQSSDATGQAADYGKVAELFCREEAQETADA